MEEKKVFEPAKIEVIVFDGEDIIRTSPGDQEEGEA